MARQERFTFLCTHEERRKLALLAHRLKRTQSDTIRLLIREAESQSDTSHSDCEVAKNVGG